MQRRVDSYLEEIRITVRSLFKGVDDLVTVALFMLKGQESLTLKNQESFVLNAEKQDQEINRLEREVHDLIMTISALYQPVANDLRFLIAMTAIAMDLEHMADSAKRVCGMAASIRHPSESFKRLAQLARKKAGECFRSLHQLDLADVTMILSTSAGRAEHEAAFERVVTELEGLGELLSPRELELQPLAAYHLKRIADYAANIADQIFFYRTGKRRAA